MDRTCSDCSGGHKGSWETLRGERCCHVSLTFLTNKFSAVRFGREILLDTWRYCGGRVLGLNVGAWDFVLDVQKLKIFVALFVLIFFYHLNFKISGVMRGLPARYLPISPLRLIGRIFLFSDFSI